MNKFKKVLLVIFAAVAVFAIALVAGCGNSKKLQTLNVDTSNAKTEYFVGQEFTAEGIVVTASLGKSETEIKETVTLNADEYTVDSSAYNKDEAGTYSIKVSYTLKDVTLEKSYDVTVSVVNFDGLEVTLADGTSDTVTLSAEATTALIDVTKIVVKEVNPADGTVGNVTTDYSVALYKGEEKITLNDNKANVGGGVYQIWVSKASEVIADSTREAFVNIYVVDDLASIALNEGATLSQDAGEDVISATWNFTATYASGATKALTIADVTVEGLDTKTVGTDVKATVSYTDLNAKGVAVTKTAEVLYTINPASGTTVVRVSADIGALVTEGTLSVATITSETALADGISVLANSAKSVAIDANKKSVDGYSFTHRLKLSGAGSIDTRSIKIEAAGKAKITVYMMSSSSSDSRSVGLYVADSSVTEGNVGLKLIDGTAQTVGGAALAKYEYTVTEAGTYYIAALSGGTNVYYVGMETTIEGGSSEATPVEVNIGTLVNAGTVTADNVATTAEITLGDGVSVLPKVQFDANAKSLDGLSFTHRLKLAGAGSDSARSLKIVTTGAAKITVYMMSSSSTADRTVGLYVADSTVTEGNAGLKLIDGTAQTVGGASLAKYEYTVSEAGTYYLAAATGGTNVYYIAVEPQA